MDVFMKRKNLMLYAIISAQQLQVFTTIYAVMRFWRELIRQCKAHHFGRHGCPGNWSRVPCPSDYHGACSGDKAASPKGFVYSQMEVSVWQEKKVPSAGR